MPDPPQHLQTPEQPGIGRRKKRGKYKPKDQFDEFLFIVYGQNCRIGRSLKRIRVTNAV
jgi:hypothetical protein